MKTILVPTDFSDAAQNAVLYAAEIAKMTKAKMVLFHVCHIPLVTSDVAVIMPSLEELEQAALNDLEKAARLLRDKFGRELIVECQSKCGFAVDEINRFTLENKTDLVVMGMHGAGYLAERLIGSVTTALLAKSQCPVLVVNEKIKFRMIKRILLATDLEEQIEGVEPLKEIARLFGAHIFILNVVQKSVNVPSSPEELVDFGDLGARLEGVEYSYHFWSDENAVDGINHFVSEKQMDMVVMIPGKHFFPGKLFREPYTKRIAFHSEVPLLVLHEQQK